MKRNSLVRTWIMIWLVLSGFVVFQNGNRLSVTGRDLRSSFSDKYADSFGSVRVIILGHGEANGIQTLIQPTFTSYFPSGFVIVGYVSESNLKILSAMENIVRVMSDRPILYDEKGRLEMDNPRPQTDMFRIRELTGASKANSDLGLNGSNVTVAIVDTGVDFGNPDISSSVARDSAGKPIAIDADGQGLVMTNTTFKATIESFENENVIRSTPEILISSDGVFLNLRRGGLGSDVKYWNGTAVSMAHLTRNYKIGVDPRHFIRSRSGIYHFGLLMEQDSFGGPGHEGIFYPVLVVDSKDAGIYDTIYVDLSSAYALWTNKRNADYSFYDEVAHHVGDGSEFLTSDFTGDGLPDISAGMLGAQVLDVRGVFAKQTSEYDAILGFPSGNLLPGLDPGGNFLGVMFDFEPHGTLCAANVASRGIVSYDVYRNGTLHRLPGIAPNSSILATKALWLGDVLYAWMWVSGFDLDVKSGKWVYTGHHRAEVISNSWGWSEWPLLGAGVGYDLLSVLEDALSIPSYLSTDYPGTLFVHAVGNGGPGYGTMTSSGFSSFALSVGASTSLHWASSLNLERMGAYSSASDDVIAWSCRGPNAIGQSKPDLLNIGAFAFDAGPVNGGYGNGTKAYEVFGGTSQAAPLTAGAAAVVIEGLRKRGQSFDPSLVKTVLMSTAKDLGNDPFVQGSGRIDIYRAASYTLGASSISFRIHTDATYRNVMSSLSQAWSTLDTVFPNATSIRSHPPTDFDDTAWFAGNVPGGNSESASIVLENPSDSQFDVSMRSSTLKLIASYSYSNMSDPSLKGVPLYFNLTKIVGPIPNETTLMIIRLDYPFGSFYNATVTPYGYPSNLLYLYVYNWEDNNHNGKVEWNETALVNYGYNWGNSQEIRVFNPLQKMSHEKVIGVWEATPRYMLSSGDETANRTYIYKPINFTLNIYCFKKVPWDWLSTPAEKFTVKSKSSINLTATLQVPDEAAPGVYGGFLIVECKGQQTTYVPVSVNVPLEISTLNEPVNAIAPVASPNILYDTSFVHGATDWRWRYESGDWRIVTLKIDVPTSTSIDMTVVRLEWTNPDTSIDIYVLDPSGNIAATTTPPVRLLLGIPNNWIPDTGVFYRSQNAGPSSTIVTVPTSKPGYYTILFHTTLFSGHTPVEKIDGILELTSLEVRPAQLQVMDYLPYVVGFIVGLILTVVGLGRRRVQQRDRC